MRSFVEFLAHYSIGFDFLILHFGRRISQRFADTARAARVGSSSWFSVGFSNPAVRVDFRAKF